MPYKYEDLRPQIFTDEGQKQFLQVRDCAQRLLKVSEAFRAGAIVRQVSGDTWQTLACIDRLVELGEIREIDEDERRVAQYRTFVSDL